MQTRVLFFSASTFFSGWRESIQLVTEPVSAILIGFLGRL